MILNTSQTHELVKKKVDSIVKAESNSGFCRMGKGTKDGKHLNVSLDGKITH